MVDGSGNARAGVSRKLRLLIVACEQGVDVFATGDVIPASIARYASHARRFDFRALQKIASHRAGHCSWPCLHSPHDNCPPLINAKSGDKC